MQRRDEGNEYEHDGHDVDDEDADEDDKYDVVG